MNTLKLKSSWLKTMAAAFAAAVMAAGAQGAEKITVDEVANHYPWDGKVDCVITLSGLETSSYKYEGAFTLSVKKDGANVSKTVTNDFASADGTYTNTFDCTTLFGAGLYPNGGIAVDLVKKELGGVQLWADGPYWAKCNVGATQPEAYGYYFWWGDTVGYTNNGSAWISVKDGKSTCTFAYYPSKYKDCKTYGKDDDTLKENGYIDSTGNLTAEYDAATAHLGGPWRMPTDAEFANLTKKCSHSWTDNWNGTGVSGYVVTGTEEGYTGNSIFLPAAGHVNTTTLSYKGTDGLYWSSTPVPDMTGYAYSLSSYSREGSADFCVDDAAKRCYGQSVRPVRTVSK